MAADDKQIMSNLRQILLAMFFLSLSVVTTTSTSDDEVPSFYASKFGSVTPYVYTRFADVERHCQPVLSTAAELRLGANGIRSLVDRLSFMNGDWNQDAGQAPLLPFPGSYYADAAAGAGPHQQFEPVSLVSFMVTHTDAAPQPRGAGTTAFNVSGLLTLSVGRNCCCSSMDQDPRAQPPEFVLRKNGDSKLHIQFQGVYTETRGAVTAGGGGERVLCMVGKALLPMRGCNSSDPWGWTKKNCSVISSAGAPPVMFDDNILLVLRYPKRRDLANRAVHGEMVSTIPSDSGGAYFDKVRLVSVLHRYYSPYHMQPKVGELDDISTAGSGCSTTHPSLRDDGDVAGYRGASFCDILREFTPDDYGVMDVVPSGNCSSSDEFCSPLGLFENTRPPATASATATAFTRSAAIAVRGVECEPASGKDGGARVSAVFRFVPPWEHQPTAAKRTGLSGTTLSAEGSWSASTGRLCMLACRGVGKEACHHRVTLYVATTFSITRRGVVVGHIASMDGSHSPVSFRQLLSPRHHWQQFDRPGETLRVAYNYTKIKQASMLLQRSQVSGFRDSFIAKSILSYPKLAGAADDMASLSNLGEDLGLRFQCSPKPAFVPEWIEEPFFQLQILSVGSLVGSYQPPYQQQQQGEPGMRFEQLYRGHGVEKEVLNVSAEFTAPSWKHFDSKSVISLEGVYNPDDGRMHLIGCRDVHAPWQVSSTSLEDLEDGMDCSIEVTVEYPPTTTRWLIGPVARVYVASTRDAGDPLHFNRTELRSLQIIYRDQRNELTEPKVEGFLCIAMLSATIATTVTQLRYVRSHSEVAPYISLAMLGVQAIGYSATLVMDARMLPAWPTSRYYRSYYSAEHLQWSVDCCVKALTLAALLLTARLAQKVRRSRARSRARSPLEPGRVPSDGAVLVYSFVVYMGGLFFFLAVHSLSTSRTLPPAGLPDAVYQDAQRRVRTRSAVVEQYFGVAKEWFLLPQVIGNAVWRVNCKPLAVRYYTGVTTVWLLPHIYGYLRPPVASPEAPQHGALDFFSKAVAVTVPVVGVVLALVVFVQQRWNYRVNGWMIKARQNKLQHVY